MQVNRFSVPLAKMGLNLFKFAPAKGLFQHPRRMHCDKFPKRIPDSVLDRINTRYIENSNGDWISYEEETPPILSRADSFSFCSRLGEKLCYHRIALLDEELGQIAGKIDTFINHFATVEKDLNGKKLDYSRDDVHMTSRVLEHGGYSGLRTRWFDRIAQLIKERNLSIDALFKSHVIVNMHARIEKIDELRGLVFDEGWDRRLTKYLIEEKEKEGFTTTSK